MTVTPRTIAAYLLGTMFFFYAFVQRVSPSVMTQELMRDFAIGGAGIGLLSSMYFYTYAAVQLPVGVLTDRLGAQKLMSVALIVCALACLAFATSETLLLASVGRAAIGASVAFAFVGTLSIAALYFPPTRFALLAGILLGVGMCGAIVGQAPLRLLVESIGWRGSLLWLGGAGILLSLLIVLVVPRHDPQARHTPPASVLAGLSAVLSNPQSWWCGIAGFGLSATMLSFAGLWAVPWLISARNFDGTAAAGIASTMFIGWAVGAPLLGWLSDALGQRKAVLVGGAVVSLLSLLVILYGNHDTAVSLSILFFINGTGSSVMVVCFGLVRELNLAAHTATAVGFANMCVVGAGAVMQPLIGALLDRHWSGDILEGARVYSPIAYAHALVALIVVSVLALIATLLVRESRCIPLQPDAAQSNPTANTAIRIKNRRAEDGH